MQAAKTISVLFLVCGCLSSVAQANEPIRNISAFYSLPIKPEYAAAATYELTEATWETRGARTFITYNVPGDLMGRDDEVMVMFNTEPMEGESFFRLVCSRTGSEAVCTKQKNSVACVVRFRSLVINAQQVEDRLIQKYGVGELTDQRIKAAQAFSSDAVGTISIVLPPD